MIKCAIKIVSNIKKNSLVSAWNEVTNISIVNKWNIGVFSRTLKVILETDICMTIYLTFRCCFKLIILNLTFSLYNNQQV